MKYIVLLISLFAFLSVRSQTANWTKEEKNNLFSGCMEYTKNNKDFNENEKEKICLCYLDEITKKYTKADLEAKIEVELKHLKQSIIEQCIKDDLKLKKEQKKVIIHKDVWE
jgi:hypothetical protein